MKIAFVDESQVYLDGEKCLLYGVYVCSDLMHIFNTDAIREKYNLNNETEIKWTINTGDRDLNAKIKQDLVLSHGVGDEFLVSVTRGNDKVSAFHRCLEQINHHFSIRSETAYGIIYDQDVTPNKKKARELIKDLGYPPSCQLFAEAASELTAGISVVDGFLGAYAYMVHKQDEEKQPQHEAHPRLFLRLDEFFWEIYRRIIPGEIRWDQLYDEDQVIAMVNTGYRHTLGHGLVVDPTLTKKQLNRLEPLIDLHLGCTI